MASGSDLEDLWNDINILSDLDFLGTLTMSRFLLSRVLHLSMEMELSRKTLE